MAAELAKNCFGVMTIFHVLPQNAITVIVTATDVMDDTILNVLIQMSLSLDIEFRLLDEQTNQSFRTHRNPNENHAFKVRFNCVFYDRYYCRNVMCVVDIFIVKS